MGQLESIMQRKAEIEEIAGRYGVYNIRIFGSVARGEESDDSDIDMLIDIEYGRDGFRFVRFKREMEQLFGKKVDLLTENGIHPLLRQEILSTAKAV